MKVKRTLPIIVLLICVLEAYSVNVICIVFKINNLLCKNMSLPR